MVKNYENLDFGLNFRQFSVQFSGNLDIGQNFRKIMLLVKISKISNLSNFLKLYLFLSIFFLNLAFSENDG